MALQQTLRTFVHCHGIGLHSGAKAALTLVPAEADAGIRFIRSDLPAARAVVPALWDHVVDTRLCTVLGNADGATVATVEHLMAALRGCGIDNADVYIDGPEVPIMDGSSAPFVELIEDVGIQALAAPRRAIRVLKPVTVEDGGRVARLTPAEEYGFGFEIEFASAAIARQTGFLRLEANRFQTDIARARTFCQLQEVEAMRRAGLARGGSLENAVVVDGSRVLNAEGLRFSDEFVRHKILDSVGDLYLAGFPILGRFHGVRAGHMMNNRLLRALFADRDAWRLTAEPAFATEGWELPLAASA